ncbi:MAG: tyrosine--tRNA ligase [Candidatus Pelagibacter sp. TMED197]|nr:tyrosine--tRNA ligase [Candidatus Pelagibacter sp.]OUW59582.1 MAG: tyrosine--tRNA ligase [Candidatus Pelagibacter sp. TMED197]
MKNKFLLEMQSRGYLNQCTDLDGLDSIFNKQTVIAYIGFDCTASSLHVGSLLQLMVLRLLQKHGHRPVVLLGGGTTLIGDPSGKDTTRKLLNNKEIKKNISNIKKVFSKILNNSNARTKPIFVDNFSWLSKLNYIEFLRDVGSHFTINKMLTFESIKLRLEREQSLSYMEFNYMILQAYDFYELFKNKKCILQIGGSDQWGNIVSGVELIRRKLKKDAYGLTTPLITLASGAKMGKTEKGAIWLNENLFSSYEYWQFWRNTDDRDVKKFLNFFTDFTTTEIEKLIETESNINNLKILLANEATKILHGKSAAEKAKKTAEKTFGSGGFGEDLPMIKIKKKDLDQGIKILELLSTNNIMSSKSDARRAIKSNAIKINNDILKDDTKIINSDDFNNKKSLKISFGKKKHYIIKII